MCVDAVYERVRDLEAGQPDLFAAVMEGERAVPLTAPKR